MWLLILFSSVVCEMHETMDVVKKKEARGKGEGEERGIEGRGEKVEGRGSRGEGRGQRQERGEEH